MLHPNSESVETLRSIIWKHYEVHGRHDLPWRKTKDPYRILVSEVMLQQTQVSRVIPKYALFTERFPTVSTLARSPLRDVLVVWQGLGYNRRAKMLHAAAVAVEERFGGVLPSTERELLLLPGVGQYTARAVCAFAFNEDVGMVETNIRTVLFHHVLQDRVDVSDAELVHLSAELCPSGRAREWYAAMMDYGAHLKEQGVRLNAKSKHYMKQSAFEGSDRQIRGSILRILTRASDVTEQHILSQLPANAERVRLQLDRLVDEGLIRKTMDGRKIMFRL